MSSSVHVHNKDKDILSLGEADTTLRAEAKYPISFTHQNKRFILSLHYNLIKSFLFVNATKIYQFKQKTLK